MLGTAGDDCATTCTKADATFECDTVKMEEINRMSSITPFTVVSLFFSIPT